MYELTYTHSFSRSINFWHSSSSCELYEIIVPALKAVSAFIYSELITVTKVKGQGH